MVYRLHSFPLKGNRPRARVYMRLRISLRGCASPSVRLSVRPLVRPSISSVLFSNDEKRHFRSFNDIEIHQGVRKSQKDSFKDIQYKKQR